MHILWVVLLSWLVAIVLLAMLEAYARVLSALIAAWRKWRKYWRR